MSDDDYCCLRVPTSVYEWLMVSEVSYVCLWIPTGV